MLRYTFSAMMLLIVLFVVGCEDRPQTTVHPSTYRFPLDDPVEEPNDNKREAPAVEPQPIVEPPEPNKQNFIEKLPLAVGMDIQVQNVNPKGLRVRAQPNLNGKVKGHVWDGEIGLITRETHPLLHDIDGRFTWWYVKWDNGKEGWSAQEGLDGARYLVVKH